jgi:hypothetical protein
MTVGIAKIEARAATRPFHLAFDRYAMGLQAFPPTIQLGSGNGERDVKAPISVVRRDRAPGKDGRLCGRAFAKQEQDLPTRHVQGPKLRVLNLSDERSEPKNTLVEFARAVHIIDIQSRFQ